MGASRWKRFCNATTKPSLNYNDKELFVIDNVHGHFLTHHNISYLCYVSTKFMDLGATNSYRSSNWTSSRFDLLRSIRMTYQLTGIIDKAHCLQTRYVSHKFMYLGASPKQDLYTTSKVYFMYVYHFDPGSINPKFEVYYAFYVSQIKALY